MIVPAGWLVRRGASGLRPVMASYRDRVEDGRGVFGWFLCPDEVPGIDDHEVAGGQPLVENSALGSGTVHFGIQKAPDPNDPPGVLTWQIRVTDIDSAIERCHSAGLSFELERNNPAPGWTYRRLLIRTRSGYRLALGGPNE